MPFYAGATTLPESIQRADILKFERDSMWLAFNYVANYAMLKYSYMIKDIHAARDRFEAGAFGTQPELEARAVALWKQGDKNGARALLTRHSENIAAQVLREWWKLAEHLYIKYNDGYLNTRAGIARSVFYPAWWLKEVGYENGPTSYKKHAGGN
jgi:dipeptidase